MGAPGLEIVYNLYHHLFRRRYVFYYRNGGEQNTQLCAYLQYSFSPNPVHWGADLSTDLVEDDDYLHEPDGRSDKGDCFSVRGFVNVGCLVILLTGIITLLLVIRLSE